MNRMKILHITNDYSGSSVYKGLMSVLDNLEMSQIVYTPIKDAANKGLNQIDLKTGGSRIIYSHILNKNIDRILYRVKIKKIIKDLESKVDLSQIDLIHAHTWYSDGGVAYLLSKKYGIPYIITVRNADLNIFQKYLLHERPFGREILSHAESVILISASYENRVLEQSSLRKIRSEVASKLKVIPNGVDEFWINNSAPKRLPPLGETFHVLFIGKFTGGKNILALQKAVYKIKERGGKIHLHLVGGGGNAHQEVLNLAEQNPHTMTFHGKIFDLNELKKLFSISHIFAMPSKHETFGLVYVEALLQGLPILYTHNEGIDGFYPESIGEKVISGDVDEIAKMLLTMIKNYNSYIIPTSELLANHDWRNIATIYRSIYQTINVSSKMEEPS